MDAVALSKEEQSYFETGGEAVPSSVSDIPQTPAEPAIPENPDAPVVEQEGDGSQARDERGKFVPHQALHQERLARKEAQEQLRALSEKQAILEDRWNTILKLQDKPQEEAKGPPDPNEDIFGAIKWQQEQFLADRKAREDEQRQQQEYHKQTQAEREISGYWQSSVQDYASREPDFTNAAGWLSDFRHKQLEVLATIEPSMATPAARNAQIDMELKQIIAVAKERGQNPAEIVHQLAKGWGYTGAQQQEQANPNQEIVDSLSRLEKAQQASRTLASSGGKSPGDNMTAEAILSMSNDEFSRWSSDPANERLFKKIMGG